MPPRLAFILCVVFVLFLLRIERQRNTYTSYALWVPTLWMLIVGSRPLGRWFESDVTLESVGSQAAGSPLDRLVLSILIVLALLILSRRGVKWSRIFEDNFWLILLYLYMGLSILWSDVPFVSLKRWIRLSGMIPIGLVILSSQEPLEAMESVFRRCAYILVPFSLVLSKYFPRLGVAYGRWSGEQMWVGVTMQKNGLGQICALLAFFLIWALLREWRAGELFKNRFHTYADALVLAIAVYLLSVAGSATSTGVFIIGIVMLLTLNWSKAIARYTAANLKALLAALVLIYLLIGDIVRSIFLSVFSRSETLTGRTDIWKMISDIANHNPIIGVGYGSFWLSVGSKVSSMFGVSQSHNGYLEVYAELGTVGIVLLSAFLMAFCGKVQKQINHTFDWGVYGICFLLITLLYNYTEAGFLQSSSFIWSSMLYLTLVFSSPCLHTK